MSLLSVVVPVRDEKECLETFWKRLQPVLEELPFDFEVIFVDDASRDGTWNLIGRLHRQEPRIKGIRLAQHKGQQAALFFGLKFARGEGVITLDGDLQLPPERIPDFIRAWREEGAELVYGFKTTQEGRSPFQKLIHRGFNRLLALRSGLDFHPETSNFQLLDRKVVDRVVESWDPLIFLRGWVHREAKQKKSIPFEAEERVQGKTKYSFPTLFKFGIQYLWFFPTLSQSSKPKRKNLTGISLAHISESLGFHDSGLKVR